MSRPSPGQPVAPADSVLAQRLGEFLDDLADRTPAPGGGVAAAVSIALAAGLVAMAARFSQGRVPADLAQQADGLRERAGRLADQDGVAYAAVLAAQRAQARSAEARSAEARSGPARGGQPRGARTGGAQAGQASRQVTAALQAATEIPLQTAETAAKVAKLAVYVATQGNPNLRGDALAAAHLAMAAARSAATLVDINVAQGSLPPYLTRRAADAVAAAQGAASRVSQLCLTTAPAAN